ncbi:MAG: Fic family protein [Bacteroidetes bacterium]|nr:MAG: Fic family protein [Bacteroidota bacterium]
MENNRQKIKQQLQVIKEVLQNADQAVTLGEIKTASCLDIELRTFQRRLTMLKKSGEVTVSGDTRSTRYYLAAENKAYDAFYEPESEYEKVRHEIPLSEASLKLMAALSLPEADRNPVGYNRKFLEQYRPNVDNYLTSGEKQRLARMGNTARPYAPAGTYAREILNRLLIDLSWNSSRLEGNTYSLLDTERLISRGEMADAKTALEAQMILNHKDAIEFLVEGAEDIDFNRYSILNLHALLSHNLLAEPAASGRLRYKAVRIHQSVFTPLAVPQLIEEMFDLMLKKASAINDPYEQAFFVMVHLPYLQPFDDVNKRVSRLAVNISLNRQNLAPLSFIDVSNDHYIKGMLGVYELNEVALIKDVFVWAYERSCNRYGAIRQSLGEPDSFKLAYRNQIRSLITEIVSKKFSMAKAAAHIAQEASKLAVADRARFTAAVETEIMSLHEGNFARYKVRPSVFKAWKEDWGR